MGTIWFIFLAFSLILQTTTSLDTTTERLDFIATSRATKNTEMSTTISKSDESEFDIPPGDNYLLNSSIKEGVDGFGHVKWFIKILTPEKLPIETLVDMIDNKVDIQDGGTKILKEEAGFFAFVILGFIMAIVLPICGLIALCCLCCSSKIVPAPSKATRNSQRNLSVGLIFLLIITLIGIVYMFVSGSMIFDAVDKIANGMNEVVNDANTFLKNTEKQISYVTGDAYDLTNKKITRDLDDIGEKYGKPILDSLREKCQLEELENEFNQSLTSLKNASNFVTEIETTIDEIEKFRKYVKNPDGQCTSSSTNPNCAIFAQLESEIHVPKKGEILKDGVVDKVKDFEKKLDSSLNSFLKTEDEFPGKVQSNTKDARDEIKRALNEFQETLQKITKDFGNTTDSLAITTDDFERTINHTFADKTAKEVIGYVHSGTDSLSAILFLAWILFFMGLLGAGFCSQGHTEPEERSCASSCSGCLLLLGMTVIFVFSLFFWILSTLLFATGSQFQALLCSPLYGEPKFEVLNQYMKIIDRKEGGYTLSRLLLQNNSIPLEISDILGACKDNKAAYEAFQLEYLFNLNDKLNFTKNNKIEKKLEELKGEMKISDWIFPESLEKDFDNKIVFENIDNLEQLSLEKVFNGNQFENMLNTLPDGEVKQNISTEFSSLKSKLDGIKNKSYLIDSSEHEGNIKKVLEKTQDKLKEVSKDVEKKAEAILGEETKRYVTGILSHVKIYVNFTANAIKTQIAGCLPVWNVFVKGRSIICKNVVDPLNGFWFGCGWSLFFFVPTLIVAVRLSRHLRKMKCKRIADDFVMYESRPTKTGPKFRHY